jgi:ABC-type transport system involved in multi-copper enzyme maturation permease subunit
VLQFWAMLKDSFREAVDGFVIYAMLALSALVVLVVGSLSFTPAPPDEAFDKIVKSGNFRMVFPEKGRSRVVTVSSFDTEYSATDVRPAGGGHALRLTVKGRSLGGTVTDEKGTRPDLSRGDSFRQTVAAWAKPAGESREFEKDGKKVEFGGPASATAEEQKAVTDAQLEEFVKNQLAVHAGMDADVTRVTEGVAEPEYRFDVTTRGGSSVRGWPHTVKIFFGAVTVSRTANLGMVLWVVQDQIINGVGSAIALLISIILTAFFVPNMLRKGSVDLLVSKPISRPALLVYKYVGGLTFIFLVTAVTVGGVWLALGVRSGYWDPSFLVVIPVLTFTFAILYAVSTLFAVLTRSPIVAMLVTVGFAVFLYIVGQVKTVFDRMKLERDDAVPQWAFTLVDTINNVLPRYKDLDKLTSKLIASGTLTDGEARMTGLAQIDYPSWVATFGVSVGFIAVLLALACWRFSKRDY